MNLDGRRGVFQQPASPIRRRWAIWFWMRREGASQQLGLEIVRPRCLGAEKDVVPATLG